MQRGLKLAVLLPIIAIVAMLLSDAGGHAAPSAPSPITPANGAHVAALPAFSWQGIAGADRYELQIAADASFSSPVPGAERDDFVTRNRWATFKKSVPNGTYYWHVRALTKGGSVSAWSATRSIRLDWNAAPRLLRPIGGAEVSFPKTPLTLTWSPVTHASEYLLSLSTDPNLGTLVGGRPIETAATSFTPSMTPIATKKYFWSVTPVDAEGNRGAASDVGAFVWSWPTDHMHPQWRDLREEPETFDPQFSWDAVDGAARYELEINSDTDFAPGSKVCCSPATIATSFSPKVVYRDNTYYWRVRAIDSDGNAGLWNEGERFTKVFDRGPDLSGLSIKNLHLRDNVSTSLPTGATTQVPIVAWNPVPGASSYFVQVVPFGGGHCDWQTARPEAGWSLTTAVTYWTPLGHQKRRVAAPYPDRRSVSLDSSSLVAGTSYCVRVRARSDRDTKGNDVYGDFTYLNNGNSADQPGFTFGGYPCTAGCSYGYLAESSYHEPAPLAARKDKTPKVTTTPLLTWNSEGRASFWVIVAKDPEFHNIVDYAFTQIPAYAPRVRTTPATYADETTQYYWVVLPAQGFNGDLAPGDPLRGNAQAFDKQSTPPRISFSRRAGSIQPVFCWTPVDGARRYRLQVSQDGSFGTALDDVVTDSICYSSNANYPADVRLHWRVRAEDENAVGLTWSDAGTFEQTLPSPRSIPRPSSGGLIPTWTWQSVPGATAYDLHAELPNGDTRDFSGIRSAAWTAARMTGTGVFHWKVRAQFPKSTTGTVRGPYSKLAAFTRTIGRPEGARANVGRRSLLLTWAPRMGAKAYLVQIAMQPDFSHIIERTLTENPVYAPTLTGRYAHAGKLYWRVAAVDSDNNRGNWTDPKTFRLVL
jgi:hypothetical protein